MIQMHLNFSHYFVNSSNQCSRRIDEIRDKQLSLQIEYNRKYNKRDELINKLVLTEKNNAMLSKIEASMYKHEKNMVEIVKQCDDCNSKMDALYKERELIDRNMRIVISGEMHEFYNRKLQQQLLISKIATITTVVTIVATVITCFRNHNNSD